MSDDYRKQLKARVLELKPPVEEAKKEEGKKPESESKTDYDNVI